MPWELSSVDATARSPASCEGVNLSRAGPSNRRLAPQISSQKPTVTASVDNDIRDGSHSHTDGQRMAYSFSPSEESQLLTPSKDKPMKKGGLPAVSNHALLPLNNLNRHLKKHRYCKNREKILEELRKTNSKFLVQRPVTSTKAKQL
jgi:hypothetical protein